MTVALCVFLIVFAIMKMVGEMKLPHKPATMIVGGGVTGLISGLFIGCAMMLVNFIAMRCIKNINK